MPNFKTPKSTSLAHAVRWIVSSERFLAVDDAKAVGDTPDLDASRFEQSKRNLLLALREGLVKSTAVFEVFDPTYLVHHPDRKDRQTLWDEFLAQFSSELDSSNFQQISDDFSVPKHLWINRNVDWSHNGLKYLGGAVRGVFREIKIDTEDLQRQFSNDLETRHQAGQIAPPGVGNLKLSEKQSVLRLVAGMAIQGYKYDPSSNRNECITEIQSDLDFLGIGLDAKTIRKWLKEATAILPKGKLPN